MCFVSAYTAGQLDSARQRLDPNSMWDISGKKSSCCATCAAHQRHTVSSGMPGRQAKGKADPPWPALVFTKTRAQLAFMEPLKGGTGKLAKSKHCDSGKATKRTST